MQMWHLLRHEKHLRLNETNMVVKLIFGTLMMTAYLSQIICNLYIIMVFDNKEDAISNYSITAWANITFTLVCFASDMLVAAYFWWLMGLRVQ